ncbi:MAG: DUF2158 domain-containing protein [Candidatus Acidiferrales bacterium]
MTDEIKQGTMVKLKAGGPLMTVNFLENLGDTEEAACTWFDDKHTSHRGCFPVSSLKVVES